jgi:uncharacterized protein (TIGR03437 family)
MPAGDNLKSVPRRLAFLALALISALPAQFSGLSSTADGSSVYFATTLRLKGAPPLLNGKIYAATQDGVTLFRSQERSAPPASPPCTAGGFSDYVSAETAAGGVVALYYYGNSSGGCSYPVNALATEIVTPAGERILPGLARLSPNGRYAFLYLAATARPGSSFTLSFVDLQTGAQTPVNATNIAPPSFFEYVPSSGGRIVANDGTALLAISTEDNASSRGYILKPGAVPQPFPVSGGLPLLIDAAASKVVYQQQGAVYLLDISTSASTLLVPAGPSPSGLRMSDDARRLIYIANAQVHVLDIPTLTDRALTNDPAKITEAALSADGKAVFAATGIGRLLKINADDGTQTELIGHTPYLAPYNTSVTAGLTKVLNGSGLSDAVYNGTVPLKQYLGNVTMWIGEVKVPMIQLTPNSVTFLPPWNIAPNGATIRMLAEAPGDHTPFYFPEAEGTVTAGLPQAGAIARQDWSQTYVGPINTGEIIHVFAIGFGPVSPEVPPGAAAPAAEPYARLTQPLTCSNADILYAGLAPFAVERVYQLDIRIGPNAGYQKFTCTLGGGAPFIFLTLNIVAP